MNPRPASNFVQIALRLPAPWLEKADLIAEKLGVSGLAPSRTDVLRQAIAAGLDSVGAIERGSMASEPAFQLRMWKQLIAEVKLLVQASNIKGIKLEALHKQRVIVLSEGARKKNVTTTEGAWSALYEWSASQLPEYFHEWSLNESLSLEDYVANRSKKKK